MLSLSTRPVSKSKKRRLTVENLESRFNLSGLTGIAAALQQLQGARLTSTKQQSSLGTVKPLSVSLSSTTTTPATPAASPSAAPVADTTSLFGDTSVSASTSTSVPVYSYTNLTNARLEWVNGGSDIGYMQPSGVGIDYNLSVAAAGNYAITFGVAAPTWGSFDLNVNGSRAAQYGFSSTGSWTNYSGTTQTVYLGAGTNSIHISPTWGSMFNINAITLTPLNPGASTTTSSTTTTSTTTSAGGGAISLNGSAKIDASQYSGIYNCKLETATWGNDIGYVSPAGAYVEYTVNAASAGTYNVTVNAASQNWATFDLLVNGTQAANYASNTGSWGNFQPVNQSVYLNAGTNVLRFQSKWGTQYNIGTINIAQAGTTTTSPTTYTPTYTAPVTTTVAPATTTGSPASISTSWMTSFNQLNVVGTSGNDNISVSQSGGTLYVNANGNVPSYNAASYGNLVIKGGDGNDTITVDSSVGLDTLVYGGGGNNNLTNKTSGHGTIVSVGGGWDIDTGNGWNTSYWADSSDQVNAGSGEWSGGHVHQISGFWNSVSTQLNGQDLVDPSGTGSTTRLTSSSLWGTGPSTADVAQGQVSDCFLLGPLQTMANNKPDALRELAVDLGDGTYAVQFKRGGVATYVRVDGDLPAGGYYANGLMYAHPGASGDQWLPIIEKAYAEFRTGAYSYASLDWGNFNAVLSDLGQNYTPIGGDANTLFNSIQGAVWNKQGVTIGTIGSINSGAPLIGSHTYSVTNAWRDSSGTGYVTLRNPWGFDGAGYDSNTSDGLVTMSMYQLQSNMQAGSILV